MRRDSSRHDGAVGRKWNACGSRWGNRRSTGSSSRCGTTTSRLTSRRTRRDLAAVSRGLTSGSEALRRDGGETMTLEHEDHGINGINATLQYLTLREIAAALLVYFVVYVLWVYIAPVVHTDFPSAGQFGDMYGVLNAFVSGLAMAGVILALFLQRDQNVMQARELKAALREAKEQTDALK